MEIYLAEIRSVEICIAKIKSVERDPSIMIKLSGLPKYVNEVNKREAGAEIIQFTPLVLSGFPLKKPCDVFLVCHVAPQIRISGYNDSSISARRDPLDRRNARGPVCWSSVLERVRDASLVFVPDVLLETIR